MHFFKKGISIITTTKSSNLNIRNSYQYKPFKNNQTGMVFASVVINKLLFTRKGGKLLKKLNLLITLVFFMLAMVGKQVEGATITWQTPQDVSGNVSEVITTGDLIDAATAKNTGAIINGEQYRSILSSAGMININNVHQGPIDAGISDESINDYSSMLEYGITTDTQYYSSPMEIIITGLTKDTSYTVQIWTPWWDDLNWFTQIDYRDGSTIVQSGPGVLNMGNPYTGTTTPPQFIVGDFIADETLSQTISVYGGYMLSGTSHAVVSAIQLRASPVPIPSTIFLLGLGLFGLAGLKKKKQ